MSPVSQIPPDGWSLLHTLVDEQMTKAAARDEVEHLRRVLCWLLEQHHPDGVVLPESAIEIDSGYELVATRVLSDVGIASRRLSARRRPATVLATVRNALAVDDSPLAAENIVRALHDAGMLAPGVTL